MRHGERPGTTRHSDTEALRNTNLKSFCISTAPRLLVPAFLGLLVLFAQAALTLNHVSSS